jgi:hypothetical protein
VTRALANALSIANNDAAKTDVAASSAAQVSTVHALYHYTLRTRLNLTTGTFHNPVVGFWLEAPFMVNRSMHTIVTMLFSVCSKHNGQWQVKLHTRGICAEH